MVQKRTYVSYLKRLLWNLKLARGQSKHIAAITDLIVALERIANRIVNHPLDGHQYPQAGSHGEIARDRGAESEKSGSWVEGTMLEKFGGEELTAVTGVPRS